MAERVAQLLDAATAVAFQLDEAEQTGLRVIASVDDGYPPALAGRLGRGAPPLLYAVGDPALLRGDLLGVVGSRDVGAAGAEVARAAAAGAVDHDHGVVTGAAKGVDRLAMAAALDAGGRAAGVLAESLPRLTRDPEVRRAVGEGRLCLCTPYRPTAGFSVPNAMGRNKLIYALSAATLVVAADNEKGGTWAGAAEALRHAIAPVIAWTGDGAGTGNAPLVDLGAHPLDKVTNLFPLPTTPPNDTPPATRATRAGGRQLSLDV
jgi:predicted Rossmann fold nucleotide-binding protein DprA/Smf involved in DNA uptake